MRLLISAIMLSITSFSVWSETFNLKVVDEVSRNIIPSVRVDIVRYKLNWDFWNPAGPTVIYTALMDSDGIYKVELKKRDFLKVTDSSNCWHIDLIPYVDIAENKSIPAIEIGNQELAYQLNLFRKITSNSQCNYETLSNDY